MWSSSFFRSVLPASSSAWWPLQNCGFDGRKKPPGASTSSTFYHQSTSTEAFKVPFSHQAQFIWCTILILQSFVQTLKGMIPYILMKIFHYLDVTRSGRLKSEMPCPLRSMCDLLTLELEANVFITMGRLFKL